MAKKKSKGSNSKKYKKNKESMIISGEYSNLVTIFIGIFLLYSLHHTAFGKFLL